MTDIKEATRKLNIARMEAGNKVFKNHFEFKKYLKDFGLKVGFDLLASSLFAVCCKNGKFIPYPIHIEKVKAVYARASAKAREYYYNNKNMRKIAAEKEMIEASIELLKSKGYKVYKPVMEYKEI